MKIAFAPLNICMELTEKQVTSLVIESPSLLYEMVLDIDRQIHGFSGMVIFSENNIPISVEKDIVLITQMIPFEINTKQLLNAIYSRMKKKAMEETMFLKTHELVRAVDEYLAELTERFDDDLEWESIQDLTMLLKMTGMRLADEGNDLQTKLLDYMLAYREYIGDRLFVTVNLRSYLGNRDMELFFQSVLLHKLSLFCIESSSRVVLSNENRVLIDEDQCVI